MTLMSKLQDTVFPEPSANTYTTCVIPGPKTAPGVCDLLCCTTDPQLSVACGSVHDTGVLDVPNGMV